MKAELGAKRQSKSKKQDMDRFDGNDRQHYQSRSFDLGYCDLEDDEEDEYIEEPELNYKNSMQCFTIRTRRGKTNNVDKTNQDSFIAQPNLNGCADLHLFGVYDGHGKQTNNKTEI